MKRNNSGIATWGRTEKYRSFKQHLKELLPEKTIGYQIIMLH
jgi:hypothetical protein